jgi:hypothetical protein
MSSKRICGFKTANTTQHNCDPFVDILKMHFKVISFLRRIFGPVKENYRWRCRNNTNLREQYTNLREQYKQPDPGYDIKSVRMGCLGHLVIKGRQIHDEDAVCQKSM